MPAFSEKFRNLGESENHGFESLRGFRYQPQRQQQRQFGQLEMRKRVAQQGETVQRVFLVVRFA